MGELRERERERERGMHGEGEQIYITLNYDNLIRGALLVHKHDK